MSVRGDPYQTRSLFIAVFFIHHLHIQRYLSSVTAEVVIDPCVKKPCENDGIYFPVPVEKLCMEGAEQFGEKCLKVFRSKKNWTEASNICANWDGELVAVANHEELLFLHKLLAGESKPESHLYWTGGVGNKNNIMVWSGNGSPVNSSLMVDQIPPIRQRRGSNSLAGEKTSTAIVGGKEAQQMCLSIDRMDKVRNLIPSNCIMTLPFICQLKGQHAEELSGTEAFQCQCGPGFEGHRCEKKLPSGVASYGSGLKCAADEIINLSCPVTEKQPQRIEVDYVMYGEIVNVRNVCTSFTAGEPAVFNRDCMTSSGLRWLKEQCHGRSSCSANISSLSLLQICPRKAKQFQYRYRCVDQKSGCSESQFSVGSSCYEIFSHAQKTWDEARSFCESQNGDLPTVPSLDVETIITEAVRSTVTRNLRQPHTIGEQGVQIWVGFRAQDHEEQFDDAPRNATRISTSIQKSLQLKKVRIRRDAEDHCLSLSIAKRKFSEETETVWKMVDCNRQMAWLCKFPMAPSASDPVVFLRNVSVHQRSVKTDLTATLPSSIVPVTLPSQLMPLTKLTPNIPSISPISRIPTIAPIMPITPIRAITTLKPRCGVRRAEDAVWESSEVGAFLVKQCGKKERMENVAVDGNRTVTARVIAIGINAETGRAFDESLKKHPNGFMFWICVRTAFGAEFQPTTGPVTSLCQTEEPLPIPPEPTPPFLTTFPSFTMPPMSTMAPIIMRVNELVNMTASTTMNGTEIMRSASFLEDMVNQQMRKMAVTGRTFGKTGPSLKVSEELVAMVSKGVSNMLMESHASGWAELDSVEKAGAVTSLVKAAEDSAAIWAQSAPAENQTRQLHFENLAVHIKVLNPMRLSESIVFTAPSSLSTNTRSANGPSSGNQLILPPSIKNARNFTGDVRVTFIEYSPALSILLSPSNTSYNNTDEEQLIVNSRILAASVIDQSTVPVRTSLAFPDDPVVLVFQHVQNIGATPRCVFWNMENASHSFWDPTGCRLIATNSSHTSCACNHLTNFAILMDVNGNLRNISAANMLALDVISYIGCIVSIICLTFCLVVFTFFKQLWSDRVTIHRNLCFCLLMAQFVFLLGVDRVDNKIGCQLTAGILQFTLLAAFAWMLLEGLQLYMMLVKVFESERSRSVYYHAFGYGFPSIIVATAAGIRPDHYGTSRHCWISEKDGFVWSFAAPVIFIVIINTVFLVIALYTVFRVKSPRSQSKISKIKGWLKGSVMLLCLLGTTWLFGLMYISPASTIVFAYIFTISNSFQGLFIFVFHCLMNDKVSATLRSYLRHCGWCPQWLKDRLGTSPSGSSASAAKENSSQYLKKRRPSSDSGGSSNPRLAKQSSFDSDYWSKTSSYFGGKFSSMKGGNGRVTWENNGATARPARPRQEMAYRGYVRTPSVSQTLSENSENVMSFTNQAFVQDENNVATGVTRM